MLNVIIMLFPPPSNPPPHQIASSSTFALRGKREEMAAVTEVSSIPTPLLVKGFLLTPHQKWRKHARRRTPKSYQQSLLLCSQASPFQAGEGGGSLWQLVQPNLP